MSKKTVASKMRSNFSFQSQRKDQEAKHNEDTNKTKPNTTNILENSRGVTQTPDHERG